MLCVFILTVAFLFVYYVNCFVVLAYWFSPGWIKWYLILSWTYTHLHLVRKLRAVPCDRLMKDSVTKGAVTTLHCGVVFVVSADAKLKQNFLMFPQPLHKVGCTAIQWCDVWSCYTTQEALLALILPCKDVLLKLTRLLTEYWLTVIKATLSPFQF